MTPARRPGTKYRRKHERRELTVAISTGVAILLFTAIMVWALGPHGGGGSSTPTTTTPAAATTTTPGSTGTTPSSTPASSTPASSTPASPTSAASTTVPAGG